MLYRKLRGWALRRCAGTNKTDTNRKYWRKVGNENWRFCAHDGTKLVNHTDILIKRYVKVQGARSPYDGDTLLASWGYSSSAQIKRSDYDAICKAAIAAKQQNLAKASS
jgi:hypothetical protein